MFIRSNLFHWSVLLLSVILLGCNPQSPEQKWTINELEYLQSQGLSVLAFHNFYSGGKQGGIEIIHHGDRIATNSCIRMARVAGRRSVTRKRQFVK